MFMTWEEEISGDHQNPVAIVSRKEAVESHRMSGINLPQGQN